MIKYHPIAEFKINLSGIKATLHRLVFRVETIKADTERLIRFRDALVVVYHGLASLTHLKPVILSAVTGGFTDRCAHRNENVPLFHEPPRITLTAPDAGPRGLQAVPLS